MDVSWPIISPYSSTLALRSLLSPTTSITDSMIAISKRTMLSILTNLPSLVLNQIGLEVPTIGVSFISAFREVFLKVKCLFLLFWKKWVLEKFIFYTCVVWSDLCVVCTSATWWMHITCTYSICQRKKKNLTLTHSTYAYNILFFMTSVIASFFIMAFFVF